MKKGIYFVDSHDGVDEQPRMSLGGNRPERFRETAPHFTQKGMSFRPEGVRLCPKNRYLFCRLVRLSRERFVASHNTVTFRIFTPDGDKTSERNFKISGSGASKSEYLSIPLSPLNYQL
jgi:hypothetical protein